VALGGTPPPYLLRKAEKLKRKCWGRGKRVCGCGSEEKS
jgi:hypothetical protein